ncbi:LacI family DNA-binding transcriptional regulator [uncultured Corynebacterium sp.]|uniref:LacI family DNA-binding transcriptional regulator n=1 Tax=uncultured Corynebacterium sp. TaxID=159447 RepID=UPI00262B23FD|nr:LacI family DNA-binding transcriptional regulator [uncultured Corynebacterium sp.]
MKKVTQAQVAREAGVSVSSVSLVLNGRTGTRIPDTTAEKIRHVADRLGYTPDRTARTLRTGQADALAFLSDNVITTRFATGMIHGILEVAEERGMALFMSEYGGSTAKLAEEIDSFRGNRVRAFLYGVMTAREVDVPPLRPGDVGVVINARAAGFPCILPAEQDAGALAARYLIAHGHTKIATIGRSSWADNPRNTVSIAQRFHGMDTVMAEAGLQFVADIHGRNWEEPLGYEGTLEILSSATRPTAIITGNDRIATGVYNAAKERGLRLPDDLSVISFDNEDLASYTRPGITTIALPYKEMGRVGATLLLDMLGGKTDIPPQTLLPMPLVERDSVATL